MTQYRDYSTTQWEQLAMSEEQLISFTVYLEPFHPWNGISRQTITCKWLYGFANGESPLGTGLVPPTTGVTTCVTVGLRPPWVLSSCFWGLVSSVNGSTSHGQSWCEVDVREKNRKKCFCDREIVMENTIQYWKPATCFGTTNNSGRNGSITDDPWPLPSSIHGYQTNLSR